MAKNATYSIDIVGISPIQAGGGSVAPIRVADVPGGEFLDHGTHAQLRIPTEVKVRGSISIRAEQFSTEQLDITLEELASLNIILESLVEASFDRTICIDLAEFSRATIVLISRGAGASDIRLSATLQKEAELTIVQVFKEGSMLKYHESIVLHGVDAGVHVVTLLVPDGATQLDVATTIHHRADRTRGNVRALGLLGGSSQTVYRVFGDIARGICDPESREESRFILLSPNATVSAIPSLDIASDRVDTAHKLSIAHIGEQELFYPRSRGLNTKDATELMTTGLLHSELACLKNDAVVDIIEQYIGYV